VQFFGFAGVGVIATLIQYVVLMLLVQAAGANATLASGVGYVTSALVNYGLNYRYTFRSTRKHSESVVKFVLVACVGLALNSGIMFVLTGEFHVHYLLAQLLASGIVLVWNFAANRAWTFAR
jgi:putative flippase GtrA